MRQDGERPGERPVERRLRAALDARAEGIDVRRLRPAAPPGAHTGRRPVHTLRRFALPLAGLVAAAAAVAGYLLVSPDRTPGPQPPADQPRTTAPGPSRDSSPSSPSPPPSPESGGPTGPTPGVSVSRPAGESSSPGRPPSPSGTPSPSDSASPVTRGRATPSASASVPAGGPEPSSAASR